MRVDDAQQADDELQTWQREHQDPASPGPAVGSPARFDPFELESVMLNLDAALRIRARHQFFGWTQGTLQSLVEHQLRSEEHTSELQSLAYLVCRLLLEKKKQNCKYTTSPVS